MGHPTVYPTGVTMYDPGKAWNGYTIFPAADLGALLIDMNGGEVQLWRGLQGFPNKLLPNGQVFGSTGLRDPAHSSAFDTSLTVRLRSPLSTVPAGIIVPAFPQRSPP
jgi:hypothetical protein